MSTNYEHNGEDETLAARRTAHALGQTEGEERAAMEGEMAAAPQARQEVEAVAALASRLKEAARSAPPVEPSTALRAAVEQRLTELESAARPTPAPGKARPWWRRRLAALALAAACLVAFAIPIARSLDVLRVEKPRVVAEQFAPTSIDRPEKRLNDAAKVVVTGTLKPGAAVTNQSLLERLAPAESHLDDDPTLAAPARRQAEYGGLDDVTYHLAGGTISGQGHDGVLGYSFSHFQRNSALGGGTGVDAGNRPSGPIIYGDGGTSLLQSNNNAAKTFGQVAIAGGAIDTTNGATTVTTSPAGYVASGGRMSGKGVFGPGSVSLSGANAYAGGTNVSAGTFQLNGGAPKPDVFFLDNKLQAAEQIEGVRDVLPAPAGKPGQEQSMGGNGLTNPSSFLNYGYRAEQKPASSEEDYKNEARTDNATILRGASTLPKLGLAGNLKTAMASSVQSGTGALGPAPKKPPESWKPARVVPNASRLMVGDKEELPLKGMQVDVRVDGFRARVLLDLYYFNDRPQQLEGNFQLRLPDEAAPYFFAFGRTVYQAPQVTPSDSMFFKPQQVFLGDTTPDRILALRGNSWEQPKVARMVPKEKAALAYRDTVRRRIDPALVEWSGAGVFQCHVFPLAPQSLHRVTIGYDVDLVRVGDDLELRLDLPEHAPATVVDLNVAAADARQVSLGQRSEVRGQKSEVRSQKSEVRSQVGGPADTSEPSPIAREHGRFAYRLVDPKQRPLMLRLRKPGTLMLTGSDEATGDYFATRVTLPLEGVGSREQGAGSKELGAKEAALTPGPSPGGRGELDSRPKQAIFLVDTSLSAGPQFPLWTKMLRATLENNRDQIKEFAVLFFNVETFWWQEKYVANTPENAAAVINYADNLALEGATDLGRALQEAARPKWGGGASLSPPDIFLLSDGAATWGEDRWGLLAASVCSTGFSRNAEYLPPKGGTTSAQPPKGGTTSAVFAYRTGLAGGDSRLLGYLAQRTGGAVFSLTSEAEVAAASVAHRNRPWKLTGIEMAGSRDLLVAGRPQYVYPGQQLTVVGRLDERRPDRSDRSDPSDQRVLTFTLQQGSATQTIKVPMEQVISSELAARTFGQVATNQLEDVCGVAQTAEPVATAYARHFRITGRTCSLLMLESEQDYARFNIKPEEDSFVVKERPADAIVGKAIADAIAAMSDAKSCFLAWYNRLGGSEVRFDLPAALKVFIDGLPEETFAPQAPPLACKLRLRQDLPENLRQPWHTGMADYETLDAEARRRLAACGPDDALRCLSSLVAERPGDAALLRDLAFTAIDWQRPGEAYHLLLRASHGRTFEPITFHALAHCLERMGRADLAIIYYELACGGQWDQRFGDMRNIALLDYARFLRRVIEGAAVKGDSPVLARTKTGTVALVASYAQSRLDTLTAMNLRDTADVAALIFWNTDGTDVDLHVIEPSGEECFYQHTQTASGGHISRDVTTGYGPELYLLPKAPPGKYEISAHYFATDMNRASTRTKVLAFIFENWGEKDERVTIKSLALTGQSERHALATVKR